MICKLIKESTKIKLNGKVGMITVGASGIGLAIANAFAKGGVNVAIADLDEEGGIKAVNGIPREEVIEKVILAEAPMKRMLEPEEIADLAVYLASDSARNITGSAIPIDE